MTQYDYTKTPIAIDSLTSEIQKSAITTALDYISTFGAACSIFFKADLSASDKSLLDSIVSTHAGIPLIQNQIQSVAVTSQPSVVISATPAFAAKSIGNKKLYARNTGIQQAVTIGSNTISFAITYPWVKITGLEIVNCQALEVVSMKVLDTATGTYSTVPNYTLNQFGFTISLPKDYYIRTSPFDADLFQGMTIKIDYTSISDKTVGVNFLMDEVK